MRRQISALNDSAKLIVEIPQFVAVALTLRKRSPCKTFRRLHPPTLETPLNHLKDAINSGLSGKGWTRKRLAANRMSVPPVEQFARVLLFTCPA